MRQTDWMKLSDVARATGVHYDTLRRWCIANAIPRLALPGQRGGFTYYIDVELVDELAHPAEVDEPASAAARVKARLQEIGDWAAQMRGGAVVVTPCDLGMPVVSHPGAPGFGVRIARGKATFIQPSQACNEESASCRAIGDMWYEAARILAESEPGA